MDFMAAIEKLAVDKSLRGLTKLWVCTFANCQFGDDFVSRGLQNCAFIRAVEQANITVLLIDRRAGSLSRIWCGLELHYTIGMKKELAFYTSMGRASADGAFSGPLVEAVEGWDIRRGQASEDAY